MFKRKACDTQECGSAEAKRPCLSRIKRNALNELRKGGPLLFDCMLDTRKVNVLLKLLDTLRVDFQKMRFTLNMTAEYRLIDGNWVFVDIKPETDNLPHFTDQVTVSANLEQLIERNRARIAREPVSADDVEVDDDRGTMCWSFECICIYWPESDLRQM